MTRQALVAEAFAFADTAVPKFYPRPVAEDHRLSGRWTSGAGTARIWVRAAMSTAWRDCHRSRLRSAAWEAWARTETVDSMPPSTSARTQDGNDCDPEDADVNNDSRSQAATAAASRDSY